jgi:hypothetical protein
MLRFYYYNPKVTILAMTGKKINIANPNYVNVIILNYKK